MQRAHALLAVVLAGALASNASAAGPRRTLVARSGDVRAELSYRPKNADTGTDLRLRIARGSQTLLDRPVPVANTLDTYVLGSKDSFQVRDLDGDAEPEVLVDLFTGGAHCCAYSLVYRYRSDLRGYGRTIHWWNNPGYRLLDLDGDRRPEFRTADDRFAYAFTAYAASFMPVQVWQYRQGRFIDVTRRFPAAVAADLVSLRREYRRIPGNQDFRGLVAAYLADEYLLGKGSDGWRFVRAAQRSGRLRGFPGDGYPRGAAYLVRLRRFLVRLGYAA